MLDPSTGDGLAAAPEELPPLTAEETLEELRAAGVRAVIVGTGKDAQVRYGRRAVRAVARVMDAFARSSHRQELRLSEDPSPLKTYLEAASVLPDPFGYRLDMANTITDEVNRRRAAGQPAALTADEQAKREARKTARQQRKAALAYRRAQAQHAGHRRLSRFNAAVPKDLR